MTLRGVLQLAFGIALWVGVGIAAWRGWWLPLAALVGLVLILGAVVFGPSLLAARRRRRERP
jgi:hypothetical protein